MHTLLEIIVLFFKVKQWLKSNGYINSLRWRGESNYFKNRSIYKKDSFEVVSKKSMIEKDSEGSEKRRSVLVGLGEINTMNKNFCYNAVFNI